MKTYRTTFTFLVIAFAALAAFELAGCAGGSSGTGTAGTSGGGTTGAAGTGTAGTGAAGTGAAGTGIAGTIGTAGTTGVGGSAGTTGIAGTSGAAGTSGTAGTTGSAGRGGTTGTAGSSGTTGTAGRGGTTGTAGSGGGTAGAGGSGAVSCASLPFCDTFESGTVGAAPSTSLWTVVNGGSASNGTATIDSMGAHGSSKSVKIVATSRFWLRNGNVIGTLGNVVHARFYLRFGATLPAGHSGIFSTDPQVLDIYTDAPQLRFGTQDMVFHWNTDTDQANIPDTSPQGDALSFKPVTNTWYCVELTINKSNGHLNVSVDGTDIPGLAEDGVATANIDQTWVGSTMSIMRYASMVEFSIGWVPFNGGSMTLWFDDVALSSSLIGCN